MRARIVAAACTKFSSASTTKDLVACRKAVHQAIENLDGFHPIRMENFGARVASAGGIDAQKLAAADLLVGLVGRAGQNRGVTGGALVVRRLGRGWSADPGHMKAAVSIMPVKSDRIDAATSPAISPDGPRSSPAPMARMTFAIDVRPDGATVEQRRARAQGFTVAGGFASWSGATSRRV